MDTSQFHRKYANTPLKNRFEVLDIGKYGMMTLSDIYERVKFLEDQIRPQGIEIDKLTHAAEWYWIKKKDTPNPTS